MSKWTANDIPDQTGRVVIITGANSGLGYESTLALARKGATIVMACRDQEKGQQALDRIKYSLLDARLEFAPLDLGDLASVRAFVSDFKARHDRLDILLNNAGIMAVPRSLTKDDFETQLGINHLGHFALTGQLLDWLLKTPQSRIVSTSSIVHQMGTMNFNDLQMEYGYGKWSSYGRSKLANLLFAFELQRRLSAMGVDTQSLAAHPGYASTNLQANSASFSKSPLSSVFMLAGNTLFAQSASMGALPQLYAATAPNAKGGEYYGPNFMATRGYPTITRAINRAYNLADARRLWEESEKLTSVPYNFTRPSQVEV